VAEFIEPRTDVLRLRAGEVDHVGHAAVVGELAQFVAHRAGTYQAAMEAHVALAQQSQCLDQGFEALIGSSRPTARIVAVERPLGCHGFLSRSTPQCTTLSLSSAFGVAWLLRPVDVVMRNGDRQRRFVDLARQHLPLDEDVVRVAGEPEGTVEHAAEHPATVVG
jgi:hypothetical protein